MDNLQQWQIKVKEDRIHLVTNVNRYVDALEQQQYIGESAILNTSDTDPLENFEGL